MSLKDKIYMVILTAAERAFENILHPFMIKNTQETKNRRELLQTDKWYLWKTSKSYLKW